MESVKEVPRPGLRDRQGGRGPGRHGAQAPLQTGQLWAQTGLLRARSSCSRKLPRKGLTACVCDPLWRRGERRLLVPSLGFPACAQGFSEHTPHRTAAARGRGEHGHPGEGAGAHCGLHCSDRNRNIFLQKHVLASSCFYND